MYVKYKSYPLTISGQKFAFVMVKIHPLLMRLKAEIELTTGKKIEIKSNGEKEEEFDEKVKNLVFSEYNNLNQF